MTKIVFITTILLLVIITMSNAQPDTTDNSGISFSDIDQDSAEVSLHVDQPPGNKGVLLSKDKIPAKVLNALQSEVQYKGWEAFPVYHDINTNLYVIRIRNGSTIRTYGLNKSGKPVTVTAADE